MFSTPEDTIGRLGVYHYECRGYHEYSGVFSTLGVIMSTLGVLSTLEGYHEYTGAFWYE